MTDHTKSDRGLRLHGSGYYSSIEALQRLR
jgi:hypothetical protein